MFTLLLSNNVYGQIRCNSSIEIDSLFSSHFLSLDTTMVCGEKKLVLANDIEFVYLVGIMSNISVELHSYTGHPLLSVEDVLAFKKWYIKNKPKITCDHIKRVMMYIKNGMDVTEVNSCNSRHDIDLDSLFIINIKELKELIRGSSEDRIVQERSNIKFLYAISLLADKNFISDPHNVAVNPMTILAIEDWYRKEKKHITSERIRKAYSLLDPSLQDSIEEVERYSNELEELKIKDE